MALVEHLTLTVVRHRTWKESSTAFFPRDSENVKEPPAVTA
jgi:hypothetical protein